MKKAVIFFSCILLFLSSFAQKEHYSNIRFTEADSLRGMLRPERTCYDVHFYDLSIKVDIKKKFIKGYVDIYFHTMEDFTRLQVDLYKNMEINKIEFKKSALKFDRKYDAVFINFPMQKKGSKGQFRIYYEGHPQEASNPPWDGGFVWATDTKNAPWVGVACEGDGASLWWPNKDHLSDEPDSMSIRVAVPKGLTCVANGNLRSTIAEGNYNRFDWFVSYPINNYNVTLNIANYAHFTDKYEALDGSSLLLDYYVLPKNLKKAKTHFAQVHKVLACFERYFGKYPFWEDGFALVETSYLGMEHQGAIAYGNKYQRGYLGGMIPQDMDWDYIIVHETGHEYFGNSISCNDLAEMWIHESFTTYMEALYVECAFSYEDAVRYLMSQRFFIYNADPILGPKDVNWEDWQGSDHYYKGAWVLHTLRHAINDDEKWFDLLKGFYQQYAISNITTTDFIDYVNTCTSKDYSAFFEQYLEYPKPPALHFKLKQKGKNLQLSYRWEADAKGFDMPLLVGKKGAYQMIYPSSNWQETTIDNMPEKEFKIATELFYIRVKKV